MVDLSTLAYSVSPALLLALVATPSAEFGRTVLINLVAQFAWFIPAACIPAFVTGRMSFVDVAWPWGLVIIGGMAIHFGIEAGGYATRAYLAGGAMILAGLRMGLPALLMVPRMKREFGRYDYQRLRWKKHGESNTTLAMQIEILVQAFANGFPLCLPAFLQAFDTHASLSMFEIGGYTLWVLSLVFETIADVQKNAFVLNLRKSKDPDARKKHCENGLWSYSRHPNYFGEWMVWNSLIIATIPSLRRACLDEFIAQVQRGVSEIDPTLALRVFLLVGGLVYVSYVMYWCLTFYTGAVPAEHFSVQKRPGYKNYQQRVNMFFPGPARRASNNNNKKSD